VRARGFTLIELICTIVILGTLTAVAVPRFTDMADDAGRASFAALTGAFSDAVLMVRVAYAVSGRTGAVDNLPNFGDGTVDTNGNGYPTDTANANTIPNNASGADRCRRVFQGILTRAPAICGGTVSCAPQHDYRAATAAAQTCRYSYVKDPSPTRFFTYRATTGDVAVTNP
jgi:prepilin-type N-terminal cleavage/methylation domain-containing protein